MLYFDHNATTPLAPEVAELYAAALRDIHGNPSSAHRAGQIARQQLETARRSIAARLNGAATEVVFTSGGTESNNLAILGLLQEQAVGKHVITTTIEHPAVHEPLRRLERAGVDVTRIPVNAHGVVEPETVARKLCAETLLVSVMHANNETGAVQQLAEIAALVRARRAAGQEIFLHSDGVQAFGKIQTDVMNLGVDLYAISAHKIHGPKGVGGLYVRRGTPLRGMQAGGRQEGDRRAGTENVPAIMAFARAAELALKAGSSPVALRDRFEGKVLSSLEAVEVNGAGAPRLPNTSNLLFRGVSGEALLIALDTAGMAVSTGSACASGSIEPSYVLLAMGRSVAEARSSVRFSFGRFNTADEVDRLSEAVISAASRLRKRNDRRPELVAS